MTDYDIIISQKAENDLRNIYEYISFALSVPNSAALLIRKILSEIHSLSKMPNRYPVFEISKKFPTTLRTTKVDNMIIFYSVDDDLHTVTVYRILYAGMDFDNIFSN